MSHCQITLSVNAGVALHLGAMRVWSDALHDRRVVGFSTSPLSAGTFFRLIRTSPARICSFSPTAIRTITPAP